MTTHGPHDPPAPRRPPCPVCIRRLPIDIDIPTPEELQRAVELVCERNATRGIPTDERRALEVIRALLMEGME